MQTINRHERTLQLLERVALDTVPDFQARVAAAVVYKNEVISFGVNRKVSHPFQKRFAKHEDAIWLHAETDALQKAIKMRGADFMSRCSLYVLRMKCDTDRTTMIRGLAKPCVGCSRAIATFKVKRVFYTTECGYETL